MGVGIVLVAYIVEEMDFISGGEESSGDRVDRRISPALNDISSSLMGIERDGVGEDEKNSRTS